MSSGPGPGVVDAVVTSARRGPVERHHGGGHGEQRQARGGHQPPAPVRAPSGCTGSTGSSLTGAVEQLVGQAGQVGSQPGLEVASFQVTGHVRSLLRERRARAAEDRTVAGRQPTSSAISGSGRSWR